MIYVYSKTNQMHNISDLFYFGTALYMFRTVSPSIITISDKSLAQPGRKEATATKL
jgi:hypothetical protein